MRPSDSGPSPDTGSSGATSLWHTSWTSTNRALPQRSVLIPPVIPILPVLLVLISILAFAPPTDALGPSDAPPLPLPDPGIYTIVEVDTAQELADACWNLTSHSAIIIAPGTYDLAGVSFPNGVDGRLTVGRFGASLISDVQIRGATGDPSDVVLLGAGMLDTTVPYVFQIFTATDVLIADLSAGNVYYHTVAIENDQGATRVHLYHCRLFDAGQQIVKGNQGSGPGAEDVVIEHCELFLTAGAVNHPEGSPPGSCYTNAIDAVGGRSWVVRDSTIHDIWCQDGTLAGPAILMWQGSSDSLIERTTIRSCSRGISLGLVGPTDHTGGIVRSCFIRWDPDAAYTRDAAIYTTSPGSTVLHNTILTGGTYAPNGGPVAIEVRFSGTTGVEIARNLMDGEVWLRDTTASLSDNLTTAAPSWFVDPASGDLHLASAAAAAAAVDAVDRRPDCVDDFDAALRPETSGDADIGADELGADAPIFADGFESGTSTAWTTAVP